MKSLETHARRDGYKLAQLCQAADFHPSTIHYYVKIGLLHMPRKVGHGLHLYDDTHLEKLKKIRTMREREKLPLSKIKERLQEDPDHRETKQRREEKQGRLEGPTVIQLTQRSERTQERLLDVATELFAKKGYDGTTITDITEALRMSKGSFYLYFRDKRELFLACIDRLASGILSDEAWSKLSEEPNLLAGQFKRMAAFLDALPSYTGFYQLVKMTALNEDQDLAEKAKEVLARIAAPLVREFRRAVQKGIVRNVDEDCFAHLVMGMADSIGYKLMTDPACDPVTSLTKYTDILARGVLPQAGSDSRTQKDRRRSGEVTDVQGEKVKVGELCFGGKPYLTGRIGEGEVQVDTEKIAFIQFDPADPDCRAEVTTTDGEHTRIELDGNTIVSAASSLGWYTIPFRRVLSISFV